MCRFKIKLYDLKWIYETHLPIGECMQILTGLQETNPYSWSALSCTQISERQIALVFKQPKNGDGRPKRTRYTAEFYAIENGRTVIVLRFEDELFLAPPFTSIEEIDTLFNKTIQALRRQ